MPKIKEVTVYTFAELSDSVILLRFTNMPKIKEVTVYTFAELSDSAKEYARNKYREHFEFDPEYIFDSAADVADMMGFDIRQSLRTRVDGTVHYVPKIYYSGFSSQGDGACCEGTWKAKDALGCAANVAAAWQDKELIRIAGIFESVATQYREGSFSVKHRGRYSHSGCTAFDFELQPEIDEDKRYTQAEWAAMEKNAGEYEELLKQNARDFMDWIYGLLQEAYDAETSDEQIDEYLSDSDTEFNAGGSVAS